MWNGQETEAIYHRAFRISGTIVADIMKLWVRVRVSCKEAARIILKNVHGAGGRISYRGYQFDS